MPTCDLLHDWVGLLGCAKCWQVNYCMIGLDFGVVLSADKLIIVALFLDVVMCELL